MGAQFKVVKVDPNGSGFDYAGHLGATVTDARRCCARCTVIFGTIGERSDFGPFVVGELEPVNPDAVALQQEIEDFRRGQEARVG